MKRRLLLTILIALSLAACSGPAASAPTSTPVPASTDTPAPSATATSTPLPTNTPLPTATYTPTATPVPELISSQNAANLQLVRRYGNGRMVQTLWSPKADLFLVLTTVHLKAFDPSNGKFVWETETGSPQTMMAFSADGSLATLSAGGGVKLWDPANGKAIKTALEPKDGTDRVSLSSSGTLAALTSSGKTTTIVEVGSGTALATNDGTSLSEGVDAVLVNPDGAMFWTSGFDSQNYQRILAWNVKTGSFLHALQGADLEYVVGLTVSPDSKYIAGISRLALSADVNYTLMVWNTANGSLLKKVTFKNDIDAFAFVPGQEKILAASAASFTQVDLPSGKTGSSFGYYPSPIISMNISADGKGLAAAGADGTVATYDLVAQKSSQQIKLDLSLTVPPYIVVGRNYIVRMELYSGLGADPDGKFVASLSPNREKINLIDPASLKVLKSIKTGTSSTFTVSQDGSSFASVDYNNLITIYNSSGGIKSIVRATNQTYIKKVEISPDSKLVASLSGGSLGELYLWDIASANWDITRGKKVSTFSGYNTLKFSPDGKTVASDNVDFGIYIWDIASGKQIASPAADWIYDLDYAPDGNTIAISGHEVHKQAKERENLIALYDTKTNKMLPMQLLGHPAIISEVEYSPDGKLIASADVQGNLRIWDAATGTMLKEIREAAPGPVNLVFLADNRTLVLGSGDGTLRFYQIN